MPTYEITGTNQAGDHGTWEIEAEDEKALDRIISERGLQAEKINGESVKRAKPKRGASGENDSDGANTVR